MLSKSIAIIDDEADLVNLFREALEMDGFKISSFTDPIDALNHIQKNPEEYKLVISDFRMPRMNGNDLCTKLMNLNPDLKVILISAYEDLQYDSSKFTFLLKLKPISIGRLLEIVTENLNR